MEKRAGILLPLFSVPGNQGIGDLGQKTLMMIDAMTEAGYTVWSMLPLAPTTSENCPYNSASSFAGDPIYINIDRLSEMGLLTQSSIVNCNKFKDYVDYDTVRKFKEPYFQRAFKAFRKNYSQYKKEFEDFKKEAFWLNAWTAYEVFRRSYDGLGWSSWEEEYRNWPEKQEINLRDHVEQIFYVQFLQFIFYRQLKEVVDYARYRGLKLMMDVPYHLLMDNAEVWFNKRDFMVSNEGVILEHAGTPPDSFFKDGQYWAMPVNNVEQMRVNGYKTIRDRFRWNAKYFDIIRILHFKSIDSYWRIPDGKEARAGKWMPGPGKELLRKIQEDNPDLILVSEDQGIVRPSLREIQEELKIPGMDILQNHMETKALKRPVQRDCIVYTSTHDTPTMEEDYATYTNNKRIALRRFFKKRGYDHRSFHDLVCHYALDSDADLVILNMPDIIGIKDRAHLSHLQDTIEDDWTWKIKDFKTFPAELKKTTEWINNSGRNPELQQVRAQQAIDELEPAMG